jgi:hypothetical protein
VAPLQPEAPDRRKRALGNPRSNRSSVLCFRGQPPPGRGGRFLRETDSEGPWECTRGAGPSGGHPPCRVAQDNQCKMHYWMNRECVQHDCCGCQQKQPDTLQHHSDALMSKQVDPRPIDGLRIHPISVRSKTVASASEAAKHSAAAKRCAHVNAAGCERRLGTAFCSSEVAY